MMVVHMNIWFPMGRPKQAITEFSWSVQDIPIYKHTFLHSYTHTSLILGALIALILPPRVSFGRLANIKLVGGKLNRIPGSGDRRQGRRLDPNLSFVLNMVAAGFNSGEEVIEFRRYGRQRYKD